jgi:predicted RNA-binding protein with TRAM domain
MDAVGWLRETARAFVTQLWDAIGAALPVPPTVAVAGVFVALIGGSWLAWHRRTGPSTGASLAAHDRAVERTPPVSLGETYELGIKEFTDHHSGKRVAVGKVQGFVLFVEDVPGELTAGEVIRARVLSFNRGETSAEAAYVGRA